MHVVSAARSFPLLLVALAAGCLSAVPGTAFGQIQIIVDDPFGADPQDGSRPPHSGGEFRRDESATEADPAAPDPLPARLAFARAALAAEGVVDPLPQAGPLLMTYERATLPNTRDRRGQTVRSMSGVIRVLNVGDEPVHLGPGTKLEADLETLLPNVTPEHLRFSSNDIQGTAEDWQGYRTVAPGAVAEFPAAFVTLPGGPRVLPSKLTLTVPYVVGGAVDPPDEAGKTDDKVDGGKPQTVTLEVGAYHRGLANLHVRRTGPRNVLAALSVRGELTYLGRFAALDRLRALSEDGLRRGVLLWESVERNEAGAWSPRVPPLPTPPSGSFGSGFDPASRSQFAGFYHYRTGGSPPEQAGFAEFARAPEPLAAPDDPEATDEPNAGPAAAAARQQAAYARRSALERTGMSPSGQGPASDFGTYHEDATDAAADVLKTALRTLDAEASEALIRSAEPLVRPGAVRHAGPNLPAARVPLLIELTADATAAVRVAAAAALGAFDRDEARTALAKLVTAADDAPLAAAAARSLATSRFPKGQVALAGTLVGGAVGVPTEVFEVLAEHADPAWEDTLVALAGDDATDPNVRVAALRAVVAGRSTAADRLLAEAIVGEDEVAARAAFSELSGRPDVLSRTRATAYALKVLRNAAEAGDSLDGEIVEYLRETRPPAAAEPLWTLFESTSDGSSTQSTIVKLLAAIAPAAGDPASAAAVGGRLADAWDDLGSQARTMTLDVVADLAPDRLPPLAAKALNSGDQSFEQAATVALDKAGAAPETVDRLLIDSFANAEREDVALRAAMRLVIRASPATRAAILAARWEEQPARRKAVEEAVGRLTQYGPGQAFFTRAAIRSLADDDDDGLPDGGVEPHREGLKYLDIGVQLDPTLAAAWSQRAFSRGQVGMLEGARDDYRKALDLDPYDNLAMTGLAILEIELGGDVEGGLARAEEGLKKYPDSRLFAYNMACVYGVAAKSLQTAVDAGEADDETTARFNRYRDRSLEHLVRSYRLGMIDKEHRHHAATDPDLTVLHGDPLFEQIVAGTLPDADAKIDAEADPPPAAEPPRPGPPARG